ncbi:Peptidase family M13 [Chromobacterium violaceum]|uniref:Peptidase family M13 n=1 Tax=Chromobacterium violaceum TaxID=536 RepID=A0A447TLJ4_CHRVL|nr:Peptidase family M13 [Chromobacterium violaceum]
MGRGLDYGRYGVDFKGMDRAVRPQDNLALYANGGWMKRTSIPPERSSTGVAELLYERNQQRVRELIERADPAASADSRKIADLYRSFLDEKTIARRGLAR